MKHLQEQDPDIQKLKCKLQNNKLDKEYYKIEDDLLKQKVVDGGHEFWSIYLHCSLVLQVLRAAHDDLGHNRFPRTYAAVKQIFTGRISRRMSDNTANFAQCECCTDQRM